MREIKFRAWATDSKEMYFEVGFDSRGVEIYWYDPELEEEVVLGDRMANSLLQHCVLMQYTGLKDNTKWEDLTEEERKKWVEAGNLPSQWDGKKIYEGDLLDCGGGDFFEVRWNRGAWRENHYDEVLESWIDYRGPVEVKGNIYENPELLEGKNEKA